MSIKTCTYDNPVTYRRECYQNGKLVYSYAANCLPPYTKTVPGELFFFGANVDDWMPGQLMGDATALSNKEN